MFKKLIRVAFTALTVIYCVSGAILSFLDRNL